jgi:hypothetical protein
MATLGRLPFVIVAFAIGAAFLIDLLQPKRTEAG